ncbi:hypothetical protein J2787_003144 [Chryseobacterium rhizosphaerae]|uniref:Aerolysin family beta-barrel pore-forming toxin n=1 Tax=Chryseobacterium rhizosphaerae TaxID=395937 RepID=A0AAE3YBZ3_9FLAO|nr:hypothetical protein [Chryseobacterium rhizosphaerae]MDR6527752.1 hypothetical protein [Chryseobacterium rhizosphaerae]
MKKNYLRSIYLGITVLSIVSCSRADSTGLLENEKSATSNNIGNKTEKELLAKGWTIVKEIDLKPNLKESFNKNVSGKLNEQQEIKMPLKPEHLLQLGWNLNSQDDRKEIIKNLKAPTAFTGYTDPYGVIFTPDFGIETTPKNEKLWYKSNTTVISGAPQIQTDITAIEMPDASYTTEVVNSSNEDSEITVTYSYKSGYKTNWFIKGSSSIKVGTTFKTEVPLLFEGKVTTEITVGVEGGYGKEDTQETTLTSTYKTKVPANSKKMITVLTKISGSQVSYKAPISIQGTYILCSKDWKYEVNTQNITGVLRRDPSIPIDELGIIKAIANTSVKVLESPAIKL